MNGTRLLDNLFKASDDRTPQTQVRGGKGKGDFAAEFMALLFDNPQKQTGKAAGTEKTASVAVEPSTVDQQRAESAAAEAAAALMVAQRLSPAGGEAQQESSSVESDGKSEKSKKSKNEDFNPDLEEAVEESAVITLQQGSTQDPETEKRLSNRWSRFSRGDVRVGGTGRESEVAATRSSDGRTQASVQGEGPTENEATQGADAESEAEPAAVRTRSHHEESSANAGVIREANGKHGQLPEAPIHIARTGDAMATRAGYGTSLNDPSQASRPPVKPQQSDPEPTISRTDERLGTREEAIQTARPDASTTSRVAVQQPLSSERTEQIAWRAASDVSRALDPGRSAEPAAQSAVSGRFRTAQAIDVAATSAVTDAESPHQRSEEGARLVDRLGLGAAVVSQGTRRPTSERTIPSGTGEAVEDRKAGEQFFARRSEPKTGVKAAGEPVQARPVETEPAREAVEPRSETVTPSGTDKGTRREVGRTESNSGVRSELAAGIDSWRSSTGRSAGGESIQTSPGTSTASTTEQVFEQIVSRLRLQQLPGSTRLTVQLQPEHLGRIEIETVLDKDGMKAIIRVEDLSVKKSVEAGLEQLVQKLGDAGIELRQAEVSHFTQHQNSGGDQGQTGQRPGGNSGRGTQRQPANGDEDFTTELASAQAEADDDGNVSYFA